MICLRYPFVYFWLMFLFFRSYAFGQTTSDYEFISTAQGLSQGLINDMVQDREGFIWIATKGGLNRYDGYTFKAFTTDPQDTSSISSNSVSNLLEDSKGRLWIGTYDAGVNIYDKASGRFFRITHQAGSQSGISGNRIVSSMIELPGNRILVCPQGAPMSVISLGDNLAGKPLVTRLQAPGGREVLGVEQDDKGYIWVGCTDGSIFVFTPSSGSFEMLTNGRTFTSLVEKVGSHISGRIYQLFISKPFPLNVIEIQDSTGRMHPGVISTETAGNMVIGNRFSLKTGAEGSVFYDFSSLKAGDSIDKAKGYFLTKAGRVLAIKCMLLDRSGVLWVGMLGYGLYKYRIGSNRFKTSLPKLSIQRITALNKHIVYVHGWRSQMSITSEGAPCANPLAPLVASNPVTNVLQATDGDYWVYFSESRKLVRYSKELDVKTNYHDPVNPAITEQMQPLIEDSRHRIWLCGANGALARIDPATGRMTKFTVNVEKGAGGAAIIQTTAFYEDKAGVFWLGTEHGFARLTFAHDTAPPDAKWFRNEPSDTRSLNYNYVSWFMDDPFEPGYLWISTKGGGINRMDKSNGHFVHFTTRQGLPNDVVYGTLPDAEGNIWGSTNRGLFCMLAKGRKSNGESVIKVFSTSDGLQADEFNTNAFSRLPNDHLAFGGVNGINIFDPKKVLAASFTPRVFITGIQIGNKILTPGDQTGVLKETIEQTRQVTLSHLQDVITLEFSSLDFTAPQLNKYRYQLEGIDHEWVESGNRRSATYLHLPAGNYTFKVQGSNSQGIWSDHVALLEIRVLPPWWRSWWAYVIYVLLIALAIREYLRFNVNKAKLQSQLKYEQLEAKRVKELDTVKTQLYTNITHEFRTPLTVILGMAQQVIEKPAEQFETRMDMIVRNGRSLLKMVNELLDLSKLETGKMHLQLSQGNVIHFLHYVVESFHSLAESQQKQLHFLTDLDSLFIEYDQEKVKQIVSNLLSNAIKFTPPKGNIYISVTANTQPADDSPLLTIKVKDTGIGIPEDQLQLVFDRFYQLDNSHTRKMEGTGIGLALTKELVKLMKGEIAVKSPPAGVHQGSEFTVTFPVTKVAPVAETIPHELEIQPAAATITDLHLRLSSDPEPDLKVPLILLVEDNADVVAYTASRLPEYRLVVGKDGREGFDIAMETIPDLIITDVMMPLMDGFELITKLRDSEKTSHIPVIMLTAKADMNSKLEGLQLGADAYLEKPFNSEELLVRIRKLLEMRKNLQQYYLKKAGIDDQTYAKPANMFDRISGQAVEDRFVKRVREIIEQNLTDADFTVEKLSRLIFMSHSQLHRKLDALTGCSPSRFIRIIRLEKAKELLQDPANSIASVAMDCGYEDPGYFARIFKQEYGVPPHKWRSVTDTGKPFDF